MAHRSIQQIDIDCFIVSSSPPVFAGGRGTWGNPKDDEKYIDEDIHAIDDRDPNYDPVDQVYPRLPLITSHSTILFENRAIQ